MKTEDIFAGKKEIVIELVVGILFVVFVYYLFTIVKDSSSSVTTTIAGAGTDSSISNMLQDLNKNSINLSDKSFKDSKLFLQMKDFSKIISPSDTRGRSNPFSYATSRSSN